MDAIDVEVAADAGFERHVIGVGRDARRALAALGEVGELSVALVDDARIATLNETWRGKPGPTDVLAFAQREGEGPIAPGLLGDVVIAVPTAARQAAEHDHPLEDELRALLVHGILHLLGYDHERSEDEARRMFARQREVLDALSRSV